MNKVKINNYILTDKKINNEKVILNISDTHGNIQAILNIIKVLDKIDVRIDYILIPGDILDSVNQDNQLDFLEKMELLSKKAKIFASLGNHDILIMKKKILDNNYDIYKYDFYKKLKENVNIEIFDKDFSSTFLCDNLKLNILNFPKKYYVEKENVEVFDKFIKKIDSSYNDNDNFNIMLVHSPNSIIQKNKIINYSKTINNMNLILTGHNHGGLVPTFIQDIFNNHCGIVGPYSKIVQRNAYGFWTRDNISLLVSNGVTKFSESAPLKGLHKLFNYILPPEVDLIYLKNGNHNLKLTGRKTYKF